MAVNKISPSLAIRSSVGIEVWSSAGFKDPYVPNQKFTRDESKFCRAIEFSPDGRYLAWANGKVVQISQTSDWKVVCSLPRPKCFYIKFSPKGTYLMSWEIYATTKDKPEGGPNMFVYRSENGEEVFSIVQKKQTDWEPCWSSDESIFGLMVGGEALFYEINEPSGFVSCAKKLGGGRNGKISISPGINPHAAFYVPGQKGSPSMCKLYHYPVLQKNVAISCKSFFQADKVDMMWNKTGRDLLLMTSTEIDSTGASYYGKQALHFMNIKGDSFSVQLSKEGPIHAVSWSPKSNEFCVVYGYMPSKATLFNLKCDPVFEFGTGTRNSIYYNDFGNILLLGGFGNLSGSIEVWDAIKRKEISKFEAPDSTLLIWNPKGDTFVTATTAPRLRMSNGFKVWHYSGALLYETMWPTGQELLEVAWQKYADGTNKEPALLNEKIEGIQSSQPTASAQAYRPPDARGTPSNFKLYDDSDIQKPRIPGLYVTSSTSSSAAESRKAYNYRKRDNRSKNKKRDDAGTETNAEKNGGGNGPKEKNQSASASNEQRPQNRRNPSERSQRRQHQNQQPETSSGSGDPNCQVAATNQKKSVQSTINKDKDPPGIKIEINCNKESTTSASTSPPVSKTQAFIKPCTGDPEKDKRIIYINRKLKLINKFRGKLERGEKLGISQLTKIDSEAELVKELNALQLPAK